MKNKVCNKKTNKIAEKNIINHINQNNGNSNIVYIYLKFVSFASIINQIIQSNLYL